MIELRRPRGRFARVAHRGASALALENSLRAMELAVELGCDMVELDVLALVDGTLVLAHSRSLAEVVRTATRRVAPRRARRPSAFPVATLDQGLALAAAMLPETVVQLDLKLRGIEAGVVAAIGRHGLLERVWISAFDPATLRRLADLAPDVPRGYTLPRDRLGLTKRLPLRPLVHAGRAAAGASLPRRLPELLRAAQASALTLHHSVASRAAIRRAHEIGAAVYVWTVNDARLAQRLVDAGADGIITDDPRIFANVMP